MKRNLLIAAALVLLAVAGRLMPHVWNVTPMVAVSLLAGAVLPRRWAAGVPLLAMFASDLSLGFYHAPVMLAVYGSFALVALMGAWVRQAKPEKLAVASLASSAVFFLVTNFAVWAAGAWYPKTLSGLLLAYELGVPFFRNMMLGDLVFTGVLFAAWTVASKHVPKLSQDGSYELARR